MKASKYITEVQRNNGDLLVHSGMSGATLYVTKEKIEEFRLLCEKEAPETDCFFERLAYEHVREAFRKANILIEDGVDEDRIIEAMFFKGRFENVNGLSFSIAPTMKCNLACSYCYNPRSKKVSMTEATVENVVRFIASRIRVLSDDQRCLLLAWVGGEPLVTMGLFSRLAEGIFKVAKDSACPLQSYLVTNGTLLTGELTEKLVREPFLVRRIQITLDGPSENHNVRRFFHGGRPTFDIICKNIKSAKEYVEVSIRINVDGDFKLKHFKVLVNELVRKGVLTKGTKNPSLYLGRIHSYDREGLEGCLIDTSKVKQMSLEEFASFELDCCKFARQAGLPMSIENDFGPRFFPCRTLQESNFAIDPNGNIGKCWHAMGRQEESVGSLTLGVNSTCAEYHKWMDWNPFIRPQCKTCEILPLCVGGCPSLSENEDKDCFESCNAAKFNLKERLSFHYLGE